MDRTEEQFMALVSSVTLKNEATKELKSVTSELQKDSKMQK